MTTDVNMFTFSVGQLVAQLQVSQLTVFNVTRLSAAGKPFPSASNLKPAASALKQMATLHV